jgi:two-component system phosphate regulon sensor histidine kinase PhoR
VAGLSTVVSGLALNRAIGSRITEEIAGSLRQQAVLVRDLLRTETPLETAADPLADRIGRDLKVRVTVVAADGRVLGDTDLDGDSLARVENHAARPEILAAMAGGEGRSRRYSSTVTGQMLYVALRIDPDEPGAGVVRVAVPLTAVRRAREAMSERIVLATLVAVAAAALFGLVAARGLARRLEALATTASRLERGDLEARVAAAGDDEVAHLGRSLNRMADQLEERLDMIGRERNQLRALLDGMVEGVLLTDDAGTIVLANRAFERIFEAQPPLAGRRPIEAARVPALQEAIDAALESAEPLAREMNLTGAQEKVLRCSLAALRESDRVVGAVAVFHDVTEIRRLERVRREFVANVSHELRTPLTAIKGYAETLRHGGLDDREQAARFVEVIDRHAQRLRDLIEDLLDLSSIEQGQARLRPGPVAVRETVLQAEAVVGEAMRGRRQTFSLELPAGLPPVLADRDRLAQVLINLLDNACKFTPEGGRITVSAEAVDDRVQIAVRDTGVGIPADQIERVFERFYRVDTSRDRQGGGTGLGLAIAKHLILAMDGAIEVESLPGAGTTFRLILRRA